MQFDTKYFVHIIGLENASCPCWLKPKLILMPELELELMWMCMLRMNMCHKINFSFGPKHFPHIVADFVPSSPWATRIDSSIDRPGLQTTSMDWDSFGPETQTER